MKEVTKKDRLNSVINSMKIEGFKMNEDNIEVIENVIDNKGDLEVIRKQLIEKHTLKEDI